MITVEVAVTILRGQFRLENLDYNYMGQHHPMTIELGELIHFATIKVRMIPPDYKPEEITTLIWRLEYEGQPMFTYEAPLEIIRFREKQQSPGACTMRVTVTSQYATTLLDRRQISTALGAFITLV